jgi:hypothetical protein
MGIVTDQFEEPVRAFNTEGRVVLVFFARLAGAYRLSADRDDFEQQLANVASSFKRRKPVKVQVCATDIERVEAP